ncbi:MAG: YbhB/YbcL family Raf kinase inhibitor-like protein [Peptostreptococcaceae bacterium]
MKIKLIIIILIIFFSNTIQISATDYNFSITSKGIVNGIIDSKYGINGNYIKDEIPYYSLPISINNPPKESKSFAIVILDNDAIPVTGFTWIHWCIANISGCTINENASRNNPNFIQGVNSWNSSLLKNSISRKNASYYGGMVPPDKAHNYTIICYALDCTLTLENGFYLNELYSSMDNHIVGIACLSGKYEKEKIVDKQINNTR